MRKILLLLSLLPIIVFSQLDYSVDQLPEKTSIVDDDSTQILYLLDGIIDKHVTIPTLLGTISDTATAIRGELGDSTSLLRSMIGGTSAWSYDAPNHYIYTTDMVSKVGIRTSTPTYVFDCHGGSYFDWVKTDWAYISDPLRLNEELNVGGDIYIENNIVQRTISKHYFGDVYYFAIDGSNKLYYVDVTGMHYFNEPMAGTFSGSYVDVDSMLLGGEKFYGDDIVKFSDTLTTIATRDAFVEKNVFYSYITDTVITLNSNLGLNTFIVRTGAYDNNNGLFHSWNNSNLSESYYLSFKKDKFEFEIDSNFVEIIHFDIRTNSNNQYMNFYMNQCGTLRIDTSELSYSDDVRIDGNLHVVGNIVSDSLKDVITITTANINNGDSIQLSTNPLYIDRITYEFVHSGTIFSGTGTDSTLIYVTAQGIPSKIYYIEDDFFKVATNHNSTMSFSASWIDSGSTMWIDFPSHYTGGVTDELIITIYYKE